MNHQFYVQRHSCLSLVPTNIPFSATETRLRRICRFLRKKKNQTHRAFSWGWWKLKLSSFWGSICSFLKEFLTSWSILHFILREILSLLNHQNIKQFWGRYYGVFLRYNLFIFNVIPSFLVDITYYFKGSFEPPILCTETLVPKSYNLYLPVLLFWK